VKLIKYHKLLLITNLEQLPRGTGAKYLEVIDGQNGYLVAKQWRRTWNNLYNVMLVDLS
jgi:hypothetical protein